MSVCGAEKAKVSGAFGSVDVEIGSKVRLGLSYLRSYLILDGVMWSFMLSFGLLVSFTASHFGLSLSLLVNKINKLKEIP